MGIPRPLVRLNQWFIVLFILIALLLNKFILIFPLVVGVFTLMTKKNPIIMIGKPFLQREVRQYPQEDKEQQLFNQWIATICLALSSLSFLLEWEILGYIFSIMVIFAAGLALCGYCIGCTVRYRYRMWKYKKQQSTGA